MSKSSYTSIHAIFISAFRIKIICVYFICISEKKDRISFFAVVIPFTMFPPNSLPISDLLLNFLLKVTISNLLFSMHILYIVIILLICKNSRVCYIQQKAAEYSAAFCIYVGKINKTLFINYHKVSGAVK